MLGANGFQIFGESDEAFRVQGGNENLPIAVQRATLDAVDQQIAKSGATPALLNRRKQMETQGAKIP